MEKCDTCGKRSALLNENNDCPECEIIYGLDDAPIYDDTDDEDIYFDDDNDGLDDYCPSCREEYDEVDREYQICHICKFDNNQ